MKKFNKLLVKGMKVAKREN